MTPDNYKIKRALLSVSDKSGIVEFAQELYRRGVEIISTGGTSKMLNEAGIAVKNVSEITGFPEIMDGRIKTLHPAIHAGLLAVLDKPEHLQALDNHGYGSIDLVVVNLYPFEETLNNPHSSREDIIENIDIGGPAMIRASAKNYRWTAIIVEPEDYTETLKIMDENDGAIPENHREVLAGKAFSHTAYYDAVIAQYFQSKLKLSTTKNTIPLNNSQKLRYGENPHQSAVLYGKFSNIFKQLHGKELSYNNIVDIDAAAKLVAEFSEPSAVIVKHTNPCGSASGTTLEKAYRKAFASDTKAPFGGIIAFNREVDIDVAKAVDEIFTEVIIAPAYSAAALELLVKKKNRRLMTLDFDLLQKSLAIEIKSVAGGFLQQSSDIYLISETGFRVVTNRHPTDEELQAMMFAWKVAKHVKSNAIVYAAKDRVLAVGAGQMSRVDSAEIAANKAKSAGISLVGSAVASDAFFPFADGLMEAVRAGATSVIQPGGSVRDEDVIFAANENNIAMIFTGMRHFKH